MKIVFYLEITLLILLITASCFEAKKNNKKKKKNTPDPQYYMMNFCNWTFNMQERNLDEALFGLTYSGVHGPNVDCQMQVMTSPGRQVSFKVLEMSVQNCHDSVTFYNGNSTGDSDAVSPNLCTKTADSYATVDGNGVVRYQANSHNSSFLILITSFYTPDEKCLTGDFKCGNGVCIGEELRCNKRDNCGDNSDEQHKCDELLWISIESVIGTVIFLILLCVLGTLCERMITSEEKKEQAKYEAAEREKEEEMKKPEEMKKAEEKTKAGEMNYAEGMKKKEAVPKRSNEEAATTAKMSVAPALGGYDVIYISQAGRDGHLLRLEPELASAPTVPVRAWNQPATTPAPTVPVRAWNQPASTPAPWTEKQPLEQVWTSSTSQIIPAMNTAVYMPATFPPPVYTELPMFWELTDTTDPLSMASDPLSDLEHSVTTKVYITA